MADEVRLGESLYPVVRHTLKVWLQLDELNNKTLKAAEASNAQEFISSMLTYLSVAFGVSTTILAEIDWHEISIAYNRAVRTNLPRLPLPIFIETEEVIYPWDYPGRNWYLWVHKLSSVFKWSMEYIAGLDIDDATALAQEIMVQDQFDKEWEWRRSQVAYGYDEATKKSKFIELPRPKWMLNRQPPKHAVDMSKVKVPKDMLPVGLVVKADGKKVNNPQS